MLKEQNLLRSQLFKKYIVPMLEDASKVAQSPSLKLLLPGNEYYADLGLIRRHTSRRTDRLGRLSRVSI